MILNGGRLGVVSYKTRKRVVMSLALPNVMRVLHTRYDMIAFEAQNVASPLITASLNEHPHYAERIITCR